MSSLKAVLSRKSAAMSVTADTSHVEMRPYAAEAETELEVHALTAVLSTDLSANA